MFFSTSISYQKIRLRPAKIAADGPEHKQSNTRVQGARWYLAPEWLKNIGITAKMDDLQLWVIYRSSSLAGIMLNKKYLVRTEAILTDWASNFYSSTAVDELYQPWVHEEGGSSGWCHCHCGGPYHAQGDPDAAVEIPVPPVPACYISSIQ